MAIDKQLLRVITTYGTLNRMTHTHALATIKKPFLTYIKQHIAQCCTLLYDY